MFWWSPRPLRSRSISAQLSPQAAVDELLNADRAFSVASDKTDLVTGISAMFADDVIMPNPAGLANGKPKAIEALRANPASAGARIVWNPLRAGISGDGRHGYTAGYMALRPADGGPTGALKYLAYWEKQQSRMAGAGLQARAGQGPNSAAQAAGQRLAQADRAVDRECGDDRTVSEEPCRRGDSVFE